MELYWMRIETKVPEIKCTTVIKRKRQFLITGVCIVLIFFAALFLLVQKTRQKEHTFTPPKFEKKAENFSEEEIKEKKYNVLNAGDGYQVGICGEPEEKDGKVMVCFVNLPENTVWLQLRILNQNGEQIAKSGIIKPGQWLKEIKLEHPLNQEKMSITMEVRGYEPDTYYSAGKLSLKTILYNK